MRSILRQGLFRSRAAKVFVACCLLTCMIGVPVIRLHGQEATADEPLGGATIKTYVENTKDRPARENLTKALDMFAEELAAAAEGKRLVAVDLGAGAGNETRHLIELGWDVISVDQAPVAVEAITAAVEKLRAASPDRALGQLDCRCTTMQELKLEPNSVRLINASFSLPFVPPAEVPKVWQQCVQALENGGIFTGHFFGPEHEWRDRPSMSFYSVKQLFEDFFRDYPIEIRYLQREKQRVKLGVGGEAFFDTITVIAQKVER